MERQPSTLHEEDDDYLDDLSPVYQGMRCQSDDGGREPGA